MTPPYDKDYWKEGETPMTKWGNCCQRGIPYADQGAPAAAGTKNVSRKISTGRKHRGMASDSLSVPLTGTLPSDQKEE